MMYEMSWRDLIKKYMNAEDIDTIIDQARIEKQKPWETIVAHSDDNVTWTPLMSFPLPLVHGRFLKVLFREIENA